MEIWLLAWKSGLWLETGISDFPTPESNKKDLLINIHIGF